MEIFDNNKELVKNYEESARSIGMKIPEKKKVTVKVAKNNCKYCWGSGVVTVSFPGNRGNKTKDKSFCFCVRNKEIEVEASKN